ncbi:hypothetical protein LCGC14_0405890 [marine sediment metagenome]|uniref:Uncharacterized protein n=1 Tax=marine sediment metagenome TaxID=412755 RepID=A0A0F9SV84_9ZZZZ
MALIRIRVDLAIPKEIADKPAVRGKLVELYQLLKLAKSYAVKINEGMGNEEMTVRASWHICHHDTGGNCELEQEI